MHPELVEGLVPRFRGDDVWIHQYQVRGRLLKLVPNLIGDAE